MSPRARYAFAKHTITHLEGTGWAFEARCVTGQCGAASGPLESVEAADMWALQHSGMTRHILFRRTVSELAVVSQDK